ncbi:13504_t:CDS:2 [Funneliformis caledonium]|uniref:13504_t:CDS:1 n=1 Tax=Funneliformis caledonium TaxID=1117310 RepID=A0A9N9HLL1_9GLOM|nr:13504_t:CDS:2 [Funneliformis caledonium]
MSFDKIVDGGSSCGQSSGSRVNISGTLAVVGAITSVIRKLSQKQALSYVLPFVTYPLDTSKSQHIMHMEGVILATVNNWTGLFNMTNQYSFEPKFNEPDFNKNISYALKIMIMLY